MNDDSNLVWVNKKTGLIASDSELNEMWEKPQHDFELKKILKKKLITTKPVNHTNLIIVVTFT